ncbi:MAG TPA: hypothetical protein VF381_03525 [Thermoanaerobaculia bacterium]
MPTGSNIKVCSDDKGTQNCYSGTVYGTYISNVYYSNWYSITLPDQWSHVWYVFLWDDADDIGSSSAPSLIEGNYTNIAPATYTQAYDVATFVHPHKPSAVYPSNGQNDLPWSFTLKWTSGIDAARSYYKWPVTYDIYSNGAGGTEILEAGNIACNPDSSGNCTMSVPTVLSNSIIYWRVVAKMNVLGTLDSGNPYYTANSPQFSFTTAVNPNAQVKILSPNWNYYLTAQTCGGISLFANATSVGPCEKFKIIDLNGGDLMDGDLVQIQTTYSTPWFVSAVNGGNDSVAVNQTSAGSFETFKIVKVWGWGAGSRITNGDRIAFQTYGVSGDPTTYFMNAPYGGGAGVDATATQANPSGPSTTVFVPSWLQ